MIFFFEIFVWPSSRLWQVFSGKEGTQNKNKPSGTFCPISWTLRLNLAIHVLSGNLFCPSTWPSKLHLTNIFKVVHKSFSIFITFSKNPIAQF